MTQNQWSKDYLIIHDSRLHKGRRSDFYENYRTDREHERLRTARRARTEPFYRGERTRPAF